MAEGILIDYNDGRPPMVITAGLRAPSYVTSFSGYGQGVNYFTVNTPLNPGSELIVVPTKPVHVDSFVDNQTNVVAAVSMVSVSRIGNSGFTINGASYPSVYGRFPNWSGVVMEILPAGEYNQGLFVSNSTNFTAISNTSRLMTCAYSRRVTVNGSMPLPVSGIPFGRWDNPNVSVGFDGGSIIVRDISYGGSDDVAGVVTMDLAIFNNTPPVGGPGITMTNSKGAVTFSTLKRPFIYSGLYVINNNNQSIGGDMTLICFTGANSRFISSRNNVRYKGIVMSGGNVRSERNLVVGNFYQQSSGNFSFDTNISLPIIRIPAMY